VILWDLNKGQPVQTLKGSTSSVNAVVWLADGRLASGSRDSTIRIARADLIQGDLCHKILRNMTKNEWLSLQGALYIYQPACSNLPVPAFDPISDIRNGYFESAMITWRGRALLLVLLLAILFGIFSILRKLASWIWNKIKSQLGKKPATL
jgi:WD40 repeat protein